MNEYERDFIEDQNEQLVLWKQIVVNIFGCEPKDTIKITNLSRIIEILNKIGTSKPLNHTLTPTGGLDLHSAISSCEEGMVELDFGNYPVIVNAKSLSFNPIGDNPEWWYFWLNTMPFAPSGVDEDIKQEVNSKEENFTYLERNEILQTIKYNGEEVLEIEPCNYIDRSYWDVNNLGCDEQGDLIPIPKGARL